MKQDPFAGYLPTDQNQLELDLRERLKELTGIYSLIELANEPKPLAELLRQFTAEIVPPSMQYPQSTFSVVLLDGKSYSGCANVDEETDNFLEGPIVIGDVLRGRVIVGYTNPDLTFLPVYEQKLIDAYAYQISKIVERKETMQMLRREKERAEHYLAIAGVIIVAIDRARRVLMINRKGCEILGRSEQEIVGTDWFNNYVPAELRLDRITTFHSYMRGETRPPETFDNVILTASGERRIITWHTVVLYDEDGNVTGELSSGEDITRRKQMEAEKIEAEKLAERSLRLASLGTLAGGVAHEINQPLTALKTQADGLLFWHEEQKELTREELIEGLRFVSGQAERITQIIGHMRSLMHAGQDKELRSMRARNVIEKAMSLFRQQLKTHGVELRLQCDGPDDEVMLSPVLLEQALINLVVNALHALDDAETDDKRIRIHLRMMEKRLVLDVEDNGPGIDKGIIDQIFDPFFTTKGPHRGLGLGLSITENVIRSMGGLIKATNLLPHGARFRIELPVKRDREEKNSR